MAETVWHLMRGKTCLGQLTLRDIDQPFFHCDFTPRAEFAAYEALFQAEATALESDSAAYDALAAQVDALGLTLVAQPGGTAVDSPLLHISQGTAWFRY
jgi:hypothetical protein